MARPEVVFPHIADVLLRIPNQELRILGCVILDPASPPVLAGYRGPALHDHKIWFTGPHFVFADKREVTIESIQAHPTDTDRVHIIPVDPKAAVEYAFMYFQNPGTWHGSPADAQPFGHVHVLKPGETALLLPSDCTVGVKLSWGPREE